MFGDGLDLNVPFFNRCLDALQCHLLVKTDLLVRCMQTSDGSRSLSLMR